MTAECQQQKVVVFAGDTVQPSALSAAFADAEGRLVLRPPAGLGDVWRYIRADVSAMVIIDCCFGNAPSLWHREIQSALDAGIRMVGAGGIGALRAAEMNGTGMTGVGRVYERVREGLLDADDEVLSGSDGFALVSLRMALEQALEKGVITDDEMNSVVEQVMASFYRDRSWLLVEQLLQKSLGSQRCGVVAGFIEKYAADPRPADGMEALGLALSPGHYFAGIQIETDSVTGMIRPKWRLGEMYHRSLVVHGKEIAATEVLSQADMLQDQWLPRLKNEYFIRRWLADHGVVPEQKFVTEYIERAVAGRGEELPNFLLENAMTLTEYRALLADEAVVVWAESEHQVLPDEFGGEVRFADAWALDHGIEAPKGTESVGRWVIEKGPAFFGMVWESVVAFWDALRLSGQGARLAAGLCEGGKDDD